MTLNQRIKSGYQKINIYFNEKEKETLSYLSYIFNAFLIFLVFNSFIAHLLDEIVTQKFSYPI